jgi:hypothetical protein
MAKVKITGHASGSGVLTITAPNTSTDRTITLPDSTGTLLDTTSGLDATKLSGNLPAISGASLTGIAAKQNLGNIPMDGYDKLFLKSNTTDGSTTFVDTSPSKHTLTANGNVSHQTEQKYFGTSSMQFDGTGDFISMPASHDFDLLGEDFTISFWWRPTNTKTQFFFSHASDHHIAMSMYPGQKLGLWASSNGSSWNIINADGGGNGIGTTAMQINTWYHLAFVRKGDNWRGYVNGVKEIEVTSTASITASHSEAFSVGNHGSGSSNDIHGFIDDFRWSKGVARYTEDFTLPTGSIGSLEHSAGDIVQVVPFSSTGGSNDGGAFSYQLTHLIATITPQYASSKILIASNCQIYMNNTSGEASFGLDFKRVISGGATTANISGDASNSTGSHRSIGNGELSDIFAYTFLDAPATTSAITYTLVINGTGSANTVWGWQGKPDTLILTEIKV